MLAPVLADDDVIVHKDAMSMIAFVICGPNSEDDPTATFDAAQQSYAYPAVFG
jgi:hypothetical protein